MVRSRLNFRDYIVFAVLGHFFVIISQTGTTLAISPSFGNQEVNDPTDDWSFRILDGRNYVKESDELSDSVNNVGDIKAVDFFSDGQFLDVTYWLSRAFEKSPDKHLPLYAVNLDIDSDPNTGGSLGIDYRVRVQWNILTKLWENVVEKVAPDESVRVIYYNKNYSDFLNVNYSHPVADKSTNSWFPSDCCNFTHFTIDLGLFGYPKKYGLNFFINDEFSLSNGTKIFAEDSTYDVRVPPPTFKMVAIPEKIELRPNEPKTIEIKLNTTFHLDTRVSLKSYTSKEISMHPEPSQFSLPANGIVNAFLKVTAFNSADKEAAQDLYLPTLDARVYYPLYGQYGSFKPYPDQIITLPVEVIVDPPLSFEQHFTNFWSVYGDAITLIAGGFTGGFAGWFFARLEIRKKKEAPYDGDSY